jgi:streptogramin lyase
MPARRYLAVLALAFVSVGAIWTAAASAAVPGEVNTYPVAACSNLLPAAEGVLAGRCAKPGVFAEPALVGILPGGATNSRPAPVEPSGLIATGSAGELWLSFGKNYGYGTQAQGLVRVAGDGTVRTFPLQAPPGREGSSYFNGLEIDGGGNAWAAIGYEAHEGFAQGTTKGGRLLRISPEGQATGYPLPRHLDPQGLVLGPEGNVWFTAVSGRVVAEHTFDPGTGFVGRLDPAGKLTFFRVPVRYAEPGAIAAGPDGRLWFAESGKAGIDSIAPDGTFGPRYPLRVGDPTGGLAFGREGDLWTATNLGIVRITPRGQQTLFPGESSGVVVGGEGDIWSRGSEDVERLVPGGPGIDARHLTGHLGSGKLGLVLACGGSTSACEGTLDVELETSRDYRRSHHGEPGARSYRLVEEPYSVPAESQTRLTIPVSKRALKLTSFFRRFEIRRGIPLEVRATVAGGPTLRRELSATLGTPPGSNRQHSRPAGPR